MCDGNAITHNPVKSVERRKAETAEGKTPATGDQRARELLVAPVTIRGHDAVVVIAADELDRLMPHTSDALPFVAFMEGLAVDGIDLTRERDLGRDVAL